ncbi:MAG: hypothetical protein BZ151_05710 [Desulfobacca sp. 4484_104]|nr:MAG: hypothetical protein BZ151_05710 [Desulfobacca sp. 4484_104]RLA90154.1 MAG: hypothetical protein DRG58_02970 [Deltaproteobacteria bacterium]
MVLLVWVFLGANPAQAELSVAAKGRDWHPRLVNPAQAPHLAAILKQLALVYEPQMSPEEREQDLISKVDQARQLLDMKRLFAMRQRSLRLIRQNGAELSWEGLRRLKWPNGDAVGVLLKVPVWVPARAQRVLTYGDFTKKWQDVAERLPRLCGQVWFAGDLKDINHKPGYRAETTSFELNSLHAPFAALLIAYIFREGIYQPEKRLPLLVVRGGEDTYAASAYSGPVTVDCLTFPDEEGRSLECQVVSCQFSSLAELHHGRHAQASNHRLGCALDLNDFNFPGVVDGTPNPISRSLRQYNRDAMHRLDARNLPAWVYHAAKQIGYRLPQEWYYFGYHTDWPHFDCGTK